MCISVLTPKAERRRGRCRNLRQIDLPPIPPNFLNNFVEYYESRVVAYVHLNYRNSTISIWQEERTLKKQQGFDFLSMFSLSQFLTPGHLASDQIKE